MNKVIPHDIFTPNGINIGGCLQFRFALIDWIDNIPRRFKNEVIKPIQFKSDFTWIEGWCIEESMLLEEKQQNTDNGALYNIQFSGIIPKPLAENEWIYALIRNQRFVLCVTDANGDNKLLGEFGNGLEFTYNKTTGTKYSDLNHHRISFTGTVSLPSPNYLIYK